MLLVLERIIELQREYFDFGDAYLKPMTINDIADRLKYHQSTISRAIKDKYISIPSKTIKIKDLFSKGIVINTMTEDMSTNIIKQEIKGLIKDEDKLRPFSDKSICDLTGIAHEIRNPLAIIKMIAQTMRKGLKDNKEAVEELEIIDESLLM